MPVHEIPVLQPGGEFVCRQNVVNPPALDKVAELLGSTHCRPELVYLLSRSRQHWASRRLCSSVSVPSTLDRRTRRDEPSLARPYSHQRPTHTAFPFLPRLNTVPF